MGGWSGEKIGRGLGPGQRALRTRESSPTARLSAGTRTMFSTVLFPIDQSRQTNGTPLRWPWSLPKQHSSRLVGALGVEEEEGSDAMMPRRRPAAGAAARATSSKAGHGLRGDRTAGQTSPRDRDVPDESTRCDVMGTPASASTGEGEHRLAGDPSWPLSCWCGPDERVVEPDPAGRSRRAMDSVSRAPRIQWVSGPYRQRRSASSTAAGQGGPWVDRGA